MASIELAGAGEPFEMASLDLGRADTAFELPDLPLGRAGATGLDAAPSPRARRPTGLDAAAPSERAKTPTGLDAAAPSAQAAPSGRARRPTGLDAAGPPSERAKRPTGDATPDWPERAKRPSAIELAAASTDHGKRAGGQSIATPAERAKRPSGGPVRANIAYAVGTAQLSPSSIETRRPDGEARRVMWADVVGVVVRRLPSAAPYDGATFVDIVSTSGATLRILPATTVRGETLPDGIDDRARSLVRLAIKHKPDVHLDVATREFIKGREPAAQLPDAAALAKHDARLA